MCHQVAIREQTYVNKTHVTIIALHFLNFYSLAKRKKNHSLNNNDASVAKIVYVKSMVDSWKLVIKKKKKEEKEKKSEQLQFRIRRIQTSAKLPTHNSPASILHKTNNTASMCSLITDKRTQSHHHLYILYWKPIHPFNHLQPKAAVVFNWMLHNILKHEFGEIHAHAVKLEIHFFFRL